jgi:hypothetical protein
MSSSRTLVTKSHELGAPYFHIFLPTVLCMVMYMVRFIKSACGELVSPEVIQAEIVEAGITRLQVV